MNITGRCNVRIQNPYTYTTSSGACAACSSLFYSRHFCRFGHSSAYVQMASWGERGSIRDSAHLLLGQQCVIKETGGTTRPYYGSIDRDSDPTRVLTQGLTHGPVTDTDPLPQFAPLSDVTGASNLPKTPSQEDRGVYSDMRKTEDAPPPCRFDQFCDVCSCHVKFFAVAPEDHGLLSRLLLKKARRVGWWMLWTFILPLLFPVKVFLTWVYVQLILSLSVIALSVVGVTVYRESGHGMHMVAIVHLIAACSWVVFSAGDCLICSVAARSWLKADDYRWRRTVIAMVRLAYTAACLYVAVVCDVICLVITYPKDGNYTAKIVKARIFLVFIYFGFNTALVLVIIAKAIKLIYTLHRDDPENNIKYSGVKFLVRFWIHFLGQVIVQVLMLVTIGVQLHFQASDVNFTLNVNLWIMIVTGLFVPIAGTLIFFVTHVYWTQEFLISICTTLFSIASGSNLQLEWLKLSDTHLECLRQLKEDTDLRMLKGEANYLCTRDTSYKVILPFEAPVPICFCIIYTLLLSTFVIFALTQGSPSSSWKIVIYVTVGIYSIINIYALVIGFLWIILSAAVVLLVFFSFVVLRHAVRRSGREVTNEVCTCCHNFSTVG